MKDLENKSLLELAALQEKVLNDIESTPQEDIYKLDLLSDYSDLIQFYINSKKKI